MECVQNSINKLNLNKLDMCIFHSMLVNPLNEVAKAKMLYEMSER